jgi:hypothetical protein
LAKRHRSHWQFAASVDLPIPFPNHICAFPDVLAVLINGILINAFRKQEQS